MKEKKQPILLISEQLFHRKPISRNTIVKPRTQVQALNSIKHIGNRATIKSRLF